MGTEAGFANPLAFSAAPDYHNRVLGTVGAQQRVSGRLCRLLLQHVENRGRRFLRGPPIKEQPKKLRDSIREIDGV